MTSPKVQKKNILLATVFIAAALLFYYIAKEAVWSHDNTIDRHMHSFRDSIVTPGLIKIMRAITDLGGRTFLFIAYCILTAYLFVQKKYLFAVIVVCMGLGAYFWQLFLKASFHLGRPALPAITMPTDFGFPSGHALTSTVFGGIMIYLVWRTQLGTISKSLITLAISLLIITVGVSRIMLNVHYTTDVVGGFLVAIMWLIICYVLVRRFIE